MFPLCLWVVLYVSFVFRAVPGMRYALCSVLYARLFCALRCTSYAVCCTFCVVCPVLSTVLCQVFPVGVCSAFATGSVLFVLCSVSCAPCPVLYCLCCITCSLACAVPGMTHLPYVFFLWALLVRYVVCALRSVLDFVQASVSSCTL